MARTRREPTRADHYSRALSDLQMAKAGLKQIDLRHLRQNPEAREAVKTARKAVDESIEATSLALTTDVPAYV